MFGLIWADEGGDEDEGDGWVWGYVALCGLMVLAFVGGLGVGVVVGLR